ncbi:rod shape-determining protein RodA [Lewinellaceae bacterium SD302]|nr:rod shape-determining protein RodA [Lewinellaceae bacterium SD302]
MLASSNKKLGNKGTDVLTFSLYLALVGIGWAMIYSTGAGLEFYPKSLAPFLFTTAVGKQAIWIGICLVVFIVIFFLLDHKIFKLLAYPAYVVTILGLVLVLILGVEINGATSWFRFAGFTIQPSELAKFGTCLAMAAYLSSWSNKMDNLQSVAIGIGIWVLPAALILLQPDAGSALVFASFLIAMYREGLTPLLYLLGAFTAGMFILGILFPPFLLIGLLSCIVLLIYNYNLPRARLAVFGGIVLIFAGAVWAWLEGHQLLVLLFMIGLTATTSAYFFLRQRGQLAKILLFGLIMGSAIAFTSNYLFNNVLKPHQQDRINAWLQPEKLDKQGALYNLTQSKLAISAGGLTGKGLTEGTMTKFGYVPMQQTDFIFCAVGEEQGFIGTTAVITLFLILLWRITVIAERQRSVFNRAYAYGVAGILFVHVMVNIGMTMGLLPIIGIPLPFMSKGGSSLLGFTVMLAVLLKLDKSRAEV